MEWPVPSLPAAEGKDRCTGNISAASPYFGRLSGTEDCSWCYDTGLTGPPGKICRAGIERLALAQENRAMERDNAFG